MLGLEQGKAMHGRCQGCQGRPVHPVLLRHEVWAMALTCRVWPNKPNKCQLWAFSLCCFFGSALKGQVPDQWDCQLLWDSRSASAVAAGISHSFGLRFEWAMGCVGRWTFPILLHHKGALNILDTERPSSIHQFGSQSLFDRSNCWSRASWFEAWTIEQIFESMAASKTMGLFCGEGRLLAYSSAMSPFLIRIPKLQPYINVY